MLTEEQKVIFGGKVLARLERHLSCTGDWSIAWLGAHFGWHTSKASVSRLMSDLAFASHRTKIWLGKEAPEVELEASIAKLEEIRTVISEKGFDKSHIVCMDQMSFWNEAVVTRSYGPIGGGQPSIIEPEGSFKALLYTAYLPDGSYLPPVIFTSDRNLPPMNLTDAYVFVQPYIKMAGNLSTEKWFETVSSYFQNPWLLLADNRGGSHGKIFLEEAREHDCSVLYFNPYGGKLLSVCDNPLHSFIRRAYAKLPHATNEESISSIIKAYKQVKDTTVAKAFKRVGIFSPTRPEKVVRALYSEGFRSTKKHESRHLQYREAYTRYKASKREANQSSMPRLREQAPVNYHV
jgi:hypothetical protein